MLDCRTTPSNEISHRDQLARLAIYSTGTEKNVLHRCFFVIFWLVWVGVKKLLRFSTEKKTNEMSGDVGNMSWVFAHHNEFNPTEGWILPLLSHVRSQKVKVWQIRHESPPLPRVTGEWGMGNAGVYHRATTEWCMRCLRGTCQWSLRQGDVWEDGRSFVTDAKNRVESYSYGWCLCLGKLVLKPIVKDLLELHPSK